MNKSNPLITHFELHIFCNTSQSFYIVCDENKKGGFLKCVTLVVITVLGLSFLSFSSAAVVAVTIVAALLTTVAAVTTTAVAANSQTKKRVGKSDTLLLCY